MATQPELRRIADNLTPQLEAALFHSPDSPHSRDLPQDFVLYQGVCVSATAVLAIALNKMNIKNTPLIGGPRKLGQEYHHSLAEHDGLYIDASWRQWLGLVGLSAEAAYNNTLHDLYPGPKIAIFKASEKVFPDWVAERAHEIDKDERIPRFQGKLRSDSLRDTTLQQKREVYRRIWAPEAYQEMHYDADSWQAYSRLAMQLSIPTPKQL